MYPGHSATAQNLTSTASTPLAKTLLAEDGLERRRTLPMAAAAGEAVSACRQKLHMPFLRQDVGHAPGPWWPHVQGHLQARAAAAPPTFATTSNPGGDRLPRPADSAGAAGRRGE